MGCKFVQYYVEGEDEKKLINVLKAELRIIPPGAVQLLNVVEREITNAHLMVLRPKTMVVLVFDTDTEQTDILHKNLKKLKMCPTVFETITITQVHNLEDELIRCCNIKQITELLDSKSHRNFKRDFIHTTNLAEKLKQHQFDFNQLWCKQPLFPYQDIENKAKRIKLI